MINDRPDLGPEFFIATKMEPPTSTKRTDQRRDIAIAVGEHGANILSKVLAFMYTVPHDISIALNKW